jgi:predicted nucleotidyltransferase
MRLSSEQVRIIHAKVRDLFGPDAQVRLFGSRSDDRQRGGDIDLFIEIPHPVPNRAAAASRLAAEIQMAMGDQRVDVVVVDPDTVPQPIHEVARREGIAL